MEHENYQVNIEKRSPDNKEVVFRNNDLKQNDIELKEDTTLLDLEKIKWENRFEEFENFYNNAPCGYHTWDENGLILKMNQTELNWLGYTRDEVVNKLYISDLIAEKDVSIIYKSLPILRDGKPIDQVEIEYECKNGTFIYALVSAKAMFDDNGNLKCVNSTVWNITERKKMENEMLKATRQKHIINENLKENEAIVHKLKEDVHLQKNGQHTLPDLAKNKIIEPLEKVSALCSSLLSTTTQEHNARQYIEEIQAIIKSITNSIGNGG